MPAVELDDPETWPTDLVDRLEGELVLPEPWEPWAVRDWVDQILEPYDVVAYHCTRLTDHETDQIRRNGLEPLSGSLISSRVSAARASGDVDEELARAILNAHTAEADNRSGRIAFLGSRGPFRSQRHIVHYLLGEWGGESIAYPLEKTPYQAALREIGTPTIVVAEIGLELRHRVSPDLATVTWNAIHLPEEVGCEIVVTRRVQGQAIRSFVQPGSPEWEDFFGEDWRPLESTAK